MKKIKEKFWQLPAALQKQVLIRGALGVTALLLFIVILIFTKELYFGLPCIALSLFMIVNSALLLYNCINGKYVVIAGICADVEKTVLKKRVKSIDVKVDEKNLTLPIRHRLKSPSVGDEITAYLPENAPVYEKDGGYCIYSFYAVKIRRKA